jgi:hypothetical protein
MDKDGGIILDPNLAIKPKTLRIRITENGKVTGSSQLPVESAGEGLAVEKSIRLARDSLLEEELFYEMSLETRQLLPYGVRLRDSIITVDAKHEYFDSTAPHRLHTSGGQDSGRARSHLRLARTGDYGSFATLNDP